MMFDVQSNHEEIRDILESQVTGRYRVIQDSWNPYVQLIPAPGASLRIASSARLRLNDNALAKSTDQTATFVVMYDDAMDLFLAELYAPGSRITKHAPPRSKVVQPIKPKVRRPTTQARKPIVVAPADSSPPKLMTIPDGYQELCAQYDVQPGLGDYLVVPSLDALPTPIPPWVVHLPSVAVMHVVKPRLKSDLAIERDHGARD